jgi:uncharacterized protein YcbK (DUF882 family)
MSAAFASASPTGPGSTEEAPAPRLSHLRLFNTHSQERLDVVFKRNDVYDPEALAKLNLFLRDSRAGTVKKYDPRLFDLLADLMIKMQSSGEEIHVICGYRTPESNAGLRKLSSKVAKASLHMLAEAIDIRLPGKRTAFVRDTALAMARGGVGYYAKSDFVHVDVGRVRRW